MVMVSTRPRVPAGLALIFGGSLVLGCSLIAAPVAAAPPLAVAAPLGVDAVLVAADGHVLLAGQRVAKLPLPPPPRRLTVRRVRLAGHALLHMRVVGRAGRAAELVLEQRPAGPRVLFAGPTGPQGVDGEWSQHLSLDTRRLLLFQRREGVDRCDGAPVHLFPRVFDFQRGRFRAAMSTARESKLPELRATRQRPAAWPERAGSQRLSTFRFVAASSQLGDGEQAAALTAPLEAGDGRADTSWVEGRGSDGRGEFITARAQPSPYRVHALRLLPGDASSDRAFARTNRLRSALLLLSPQERYRLVLPRDPLREPGAANTPYWVLLPKPSASSCLTLVLESVYPGRGAPRGGGRSAIAELQVVTDLDRGGGLAQLLTDLSSPDVERTRAAVAVLAGQGPTVLPALQRALPQAKPAQLRGIIDVLSQLSLPQTAPLLVAALRRQRLREPGGPAVQALRRLGEAAVVALAPLLRSQRPIERRVALRLLGQLGGQRALTLLLAETGRGDEAARQQVVAALVGLGPKLALEPLFAALAASSAPAASRPRAPDRPPSSRPSAAPRRSADLVLALTRLLRRRPEAAQAGARLARLLPAPQGFELSLRLINAVGTLGGTGAEAWLLRASRAREPILRWHAVLRLAERRPTSKSRQRLRETLRDRDPRVRAAAVAGLTDHGEARTSPRGAGGARVAAELAWVLRYERWPVVARAAAHALAGHCSAPSTAPALRRAIRLRGFGIDVQALASLVRCRPPGLFDELSALALDRRQPAALRQRAAGLLPAEQVRGREHIVASLFLRLRREAMTSASAEQVAAALAGVLGRWGGEKARRPLLDALALDPSPAIRSAAAGALAGECWPTALPSLRRALADPAPQVRGAARATIVRCRRR